MVAPLQRLLPAVIAVAAMTALAEPAGAQQVGVNSAVNPDATGTPPGAAARKLVLGQEVVHNERIATGPVGQTQVLFLDESALSVGPNADMTIDDFVYNPNTGTGRLAMSATQGVMRFVGGKLSKEDGGVSMRTPVGTLGIRGGVFLLELSGNNLEVVFLYGQGLSVTNNNVTQLITRPGFAVTVSGRGAAPSPPGPPASGTLKGLLSQLAGRAGATGGSKNPPTDASVVDSGIQNIVSGNVAASVQQAAQYTPAPTQAQPVTPNTVMAQANLSTVSTQSVSEPQSSSQPSPPSPPPPQSVIVQIGGLLKGTNGVPTIGGFIDQSANARFPYNGILTFPPGGPLTNGVASGTLGGNINFSFGPLTPGQTNPATITVSDGAPASGNATFTSDGSFFFANLVSSNPSGDRVFFFGGTPVAQSFFTTTTPASQFFAFAIQPDAALVGAGGAGQTIPFLPSNFGGTSPNATVSPLFMVTPANTTFGSNNAVTNPNVQAPRTLQASLAINGAGAAQSSALVVATGAFFTSSDTGKVTTFNLIHGTVLNSATGPLTHIISGSAGVPDAANNSLFGGTSISGFVIDQNSFNATDNFVPQLATAVVAQPGTNLVNYAFNQPVLAASLPAGVGTNRSALSETMFAGGIAQFGGFAGTPTSYVLATTSAGSLQTDPTNNRMQAQFTAADPFTSGTSGIRTETLQFGAIAGNNFSRSSYVDNNLFGAGENPNTPSQVNGTNLPTFSQTGSSSTTPQLALVSSAVVNNAAPALPPGAAFCQCQFLQWGYWTGQVPVPGLGPGGAPRTDEANINTWVAGTPAVNLPTSGVGTFSGAAVGTINNNGATYLAAGGFTNTFNFGSGTGTVTISNLDGRTYTGTVSASGVQYAGTIAGTGTNANLSGALGGSFYGPGAPETGGVFAVHNTSGANYLAAGIFAAKR